MKTSKIILLMTVVAFAVVSLSAKADGFEKTLKHGKVVNLDLEQAARVPGLVSYMHRYLEPDFLNVNQQSYSVEIIYMHNTFKITGSYEQWVSFFWPKWLKPGSGVERSYVRVR